jgi:PhnB protein
MKKTTLVPRLVVADAPAAIAWYVDALGARELVRHATKEGRIVHAELEVLGALLYVVEQEPAWHNHAPPSLGGSPVLLCLDVEEVDALGARMEAKGAKVIFPIADQFYGERGGRLQDPFGHVWLIAKTIEELSPEEMNERMAAL